MRKLLTIATLLLLFSCNKSTDSTPLSMEPENSIEIRTYDKISYEQARVIAGKAYLDFESEATKGIEKQIIDNSIIGDNSTATKSGNSPIDTLLYVFNYANDGGYVVIPTNNVNGQIVAYVEQGNFNIQDTLDNELSKMLVHLMINNQLRANALYEAALVQTKNPFGTMETIPIGPMCKSSEPVYNPVFPAPGPPGPGGNSDIDYATRYGCYRPVNQFAEPTTVYNKTPLLTTNWNQGSPYNNQAKIIETKRAWAGCVAIAASQIMAYHAHPTIYPSTIVNTLVPSNFHSYSGKNTSLISLRKIKDFTKEGSFAAKDHLSRFIAIVGYMLNNGWGLDGTGAFSGDIPALLYALGYNMSSLVDYDIITVKNSLNQNKPLYIRGTSHESSTVKGGGHAWVLDGYKTIKWRVDRYAILFDEKGKFMKTKYVSTGFADEEFLHCNFGWGGSSNGYYSDGIFNTSNPNELTGNGKNSGYYFDDGLKVIPYITKR